MAHGTDASIPHPPLWFWIVFHVIIIIMIIIDILTLEHEDRDPTIKETLIMTIIWILTGVLFGVYILYAYGSLPALLYYAAFLVEKSLSMDNMFVFYAIFSYFGVEYRYQHKVLLIGILSAALFRAAFILGGIYLIERIHWTIVVFGIILIISGIRLSIRKGEENVDPERNPIVRLARRILPITPRYYGSHFIVRENGAIRFTPLIVVLLAIETTDVIFAVDSVPAVLAITTDFFIAYTSNILAILGLRALYMFIALLIRRLEYLHVGLGILLAYLGVKMILSFLGFEIPIVLSLAIVFTILILSFVVSFIISKIKHESLGEEMSSEA
ncbi:MAG: TerC/Alx family metal homeostasis membrane protein [Candidatus Njordarchaeales archaeon]